MLNVNCFIVSHYFIERINDCVLLPNLFFEKYPNRVIDVFSQALEIWSLSAPQCDSRTVST